MTTRWLTNAATDTIAVDDSYFPILVATFVGGPSEDTFRAYFAWLHEMLGRATKEKAPLIVNVTDAGLSSVPSAPVRRLIADLTKTWNDAGAGTRVPVTSYVVVENAAIRGVLRVLDWLHGDLKTNNVPTARDALEGAIAALAQVKVSAPIGLTPSRYQRPSRLRAS